MRPVAKTMSTASGRSWLGALTHIRGSEVDEDGDLGLREPTEQLAVETCHKRAKQTAINGDQCGVDVSSVMLRKRSPNSESRGEFLTLSRVP